MQEWLKSLKLPPAKLKSLETVLLDPEVSAVTKDAFMARADYSRSMDALKKEQTDAQKKIADQEAKNAKYYADLGTWKGDADKKYADGQKALEVANNRLAQITNKMGTLKNQYSIEDADLVDILNPANPAPVVTAPVVVDPNKDNYLSREKYNQDVDEFRTQFPLIPATLADLEDKHRALFGTALPGKRQLVEEAMKAGKSLDAYAAEKFGFAAREEEIKKENWQKDADLKFKEREDAIRSEYANPAAPPLVNPVSPILTRTMPRGLDDGGKQVAVDPHRGVKAAVAAYKGSGAA